MSGRVRRWFEKLLGPEPAPFEVPEWSPHVEAAAEAMYQRLNVTEKKPPWSELDIDAVDHYCIAAQFAVEAFHKSAIQDVVGYL